MQQDATRLHSRSQYAYDPCGRRHDWWPGSFPAIFLSVIVVAVWFAGIFVVKDGFTDTNYQLIIGSGTAIITFWMVFIIQNTQNRDAKASPGLAPSQYSGQGWSAER